MVASIMILILVYMKYAHPVNFIVHKFIKHNVIFACYDAENEQSQQQEQGQSNERISSLHVKLQQEADRIRKWKVQTEIEIKQKVGFSIVTVSVNCN